MHFSLKALLIAFPIAAVAIWAWDGINVIKADGGHTLKIAIERVDADVAEISYAALRTDQLEFAMQYFPNPEIPFTLADSGTISVRLPWSSTTTQSGRTLQYVETFDSVLFRIEYHSRRAEFRVFKIPGKDERTELKIAL